MAKVRSIKRSSKRRRQARNKILLVIACLILVVLWISPVTLKLVQAKRQNDSLKVQLAGEKISKKELQKRVKKLHSNNYIELEARKQLGYVKPGEKAYLVIQKEVPPKKKPVAKQKSWFQEVIDFFKESI